MRAQRSQQCQEVSKPLLAARLILLVFSVCLLRATLSARLRVAGAALRAAPRALASALLAASHPPRCASSIVSAFRHACAWIATAPLIKYNCALFLLVCQTFMARVDCNNNGIAND